MADLDLITRAAAAVGIDPATIHSVTLSTAGDVVVLDNQLRKWRLPADAVEPVAAAPQQAADTQADAVTQIAAAPIAPAPKARKAQGR